MAQVDFSWIAGLADPLIEAARKKQEADALVAYALPGAAATPAAPGADRASALMASAPVPAGPRPPTFAAIQGDQPSGKMADLIASAANKYGVDPNALVRVAQIESGLNPNAQNPNSSAGGLGQFINSTWAQYGGGASKFDPNANADAMARLARDNAAGLKQAIGRDPTPGELYLAHQQGLKGAINLLQNVNARASDVVGEQAVRLNGGTPDMTAGQFAALWDKKMGGAGASPAVSAPATAAAQPAQPPATPGQSATAGTAWTPTPQERARYSSMIAAGGAARQLALQEIQARQKGPEFKVVGDQAFWVDPRTRTATPASVQKPVNWQHVQTNDGRLLAFNPQTRETQILDAGGSWRPMTEAERNVYHVPENTGSAIGPGGKPLIMPGTPKNATESAYDASQGKAQSERFTEINNQGRTAGSQLNTLKVMEGLLDNPNFYSGYNGPVAKKANQLLSSIGIKDANAAAPAEVFSALSNKMVQEASGGSLGQGISNTDRDFLVESGPSLSATKEGNRELIFLQRKLLERQQEIADKARVYAKNNNGRLDAGFDGELAQWAKEHPVFSDEDMARVRGKAGAAPAAAPATATATAPPAAAIDHLRANPGLRRDFDLKYGTGASDRVLGGGPNA